MPTYEYKCESCGAVTEVFHGFRDPGPSECSCGAHGSLKRLISSGSGLIFKGSGFYETDYKRKPSEKPETKSIEGSGDKEKPKPAPKPEVAKESKTSAKTDS